MKRFLTIGVALALFTVTTASAQDAGDDWDITLDAARKATAASSTFGNGLTLAVRCIDGRYDAIMTGLPTARGEETRDLTLQFGDGAPRASRWSNAAVDGMVVSDLPAPFARRLREGGRLQVVIRGGAEGGRNLRYVLDLPASAAAIDRTLQACGRPLVDPRDAELSEIGDSGLPGGLTWARRPEPNYPEGRTFTKGFAVVTCLNRPDGALRDCTVETEYPANGGFGEAALQATRRARLRNDPASNAPMPPRMIVYRTNFRTTEDFETPPSTGTHIPR